MFHAPRLRMSVRSATGVATIANFA
jgi:hypothetical protein